jgi:hypothetical protein
MTRYVTLSRLTRLPLSYSLLPRRSERLVVQTELLESIHPSYK